MWCHINIYVSDLIPSITITINHIIIYVLIIITYITTTPLMNYLGKGWWIEIHVIRKIVWRSPRINGPKLFHNPPPHIRWMPIDLINTPWRMIRVPNAIGWKKSLIWKKFKMSEESRTQACVMSKTKKTMELLFEAIYFCFF